MNKKAHNESLLSDRINVVYGTSGITSSGAVVNGLGVKIKRLEEIASILDVEIKRLKSEKTDLWQICQKEFFEANALNDKQKSINLGTANSITNFKHTLQQYQNEFDSEFNDLDKRVIAIINGFEILDVLIATQHADHEERLIEQKEFAIHVNQNVLKLGMLITDINHNFEDEIAKIKTSLDTEATVRVASTCDIYTKMDRLRTSIEMHYEENHKMRIRWNKFKRLIRSWFYW